MLVRDLYGYKNPMLHCGPYFLPLKFRFSTIVQFQKWNLKSNQVKRMQCQRGMWNRLFHNFEKGTEESGPFSHPFSSKQETWGIPSCPVVSVWLEVPEIFLIF